MTRYQMCSGCFDGIINQIALRTKYRVNTHSHRAVAFYLLTLVIHQTLALIPLFVRNSKTISGFPANRDREKPNWIATLCVGFLSSAPLNFELFVFSKAFVLKSNYTRIQCDVIRRDSSLRSTKMILLMLFFILSLFKTHKVFARHAIAI